MNSRNERQSATDFAERVRTNQRKLGSDLKARYDFVVCGSGSAGWISNIEPRECSKVWPACEWLDTAR
jgi:hypothetical protein